MKKNCREYKECGGKLPYSHSIWHVFVLGGSSMQFIAIYLYVL